MNPFILLVNSITEVPWMGCCVVYSHYCNSINKHRLCETELFYYIAPVNVLKEAYRIGSAN